MAVCKSCGKIINELEQVRTGVEKARFFIKDGFYDYEGETFDSDGDFLEFRCMECGESLFDNYEEAEEFLKNKDEVAEMVAKKIEMNKNENKRKNNRST